MYAEDQSKPPQRSATPFRWALYLGITLGVVASLANFIARAVNGGSFALGEWPRFAIFSFVWFIVPAVLLCWLVAAVVVAVDLLLRHTAYRFSLRTLLLVVTILAAVAAVIKGTNPAVVAALWWILLFSLMGGWMQRARPIVLTEEASEQGQPRISPAESIQQLPPARE